MCGLFWAVRLAESVFDPPMKELVHHFAWAPVAAGILDFFFENSMSLFMLENPTNIPNIWVFVFLAAPAALKWFLLVATSGLLFSALLIFLLTPIRSHWAKRYRVPNRRPQRASPAEVLHQELDLLQRSRRAEIKSRPNMTADCGANARAYNSNLFGLALSGGGIRSATFSLGVLQALARRKILSRFDYLSTVSGGGYIGAWLSAWISRESGEIEKVQEQLQNKDKPIEQIEFLRAYSNYLTPRTGFLGVDTWTAVATWTRNFLVNAVIVLLSIWCVLAFIMFAARIANRFEYVVGILSAVLLLIPICSITLGVGLSDLGRKRVAKKHLWLTRFISGPGIFLSVVLALPMAFAGGGFWLARWDLTQSAWESLSWPLGLIAFVDLLWFGMLGIFCRRCNKSKPSSAATKSAMPTCLKFIWFISKVVVKFRQLLMPTRVKFIWVISVIVGLGMMAATIWFGMRYLLLDLHYYLFAANRQITADWDHQRLNTAIVMMFSPMIMLLGTLIGVYTAILILGRNYSDKGREWWARIGGWYNLLLIFWLMIVVSGFLVPGVVHWLGSTNGKGTNWTYVLGATYAAITALTGLLARSAPSTGGAGAVKGLVLKVGPYLVVSGFYILAVYWFFRAVTFVFSVPELWPPMGGKPLNFSAGSELLPLMSAEGNSLTSNINAGVRMLLSPSIPCLFMFGAGCGYLALFLSLCADVNIFSLRDFYKNRLVRAYLGATVKKREAKKDPFTGFSESDDILLWQLRKNGRPYHLINAALNIVQGRRLAWQERKAASFLFSPLYCGYSLPHPEDDDTDHNYCSTEVYGDEGKLTDQKTREPTGGVMLGDAMALSGAALSSNSGYSSTPILTLMKTLLNVRLGGWLPNPGVREERRISPPIAGKYLLAEFFGLTNERSDFVNVSDGGHFENLGVYELVRRRCRLILVVDATQDQDRMFDDLGGCIRKCQIDFNVQIDLDVTSLIPNDQRISPKTWSLGTIKYPSDGTGEWEGKILYLKASIIEPIRTQASLLSYFRMQRDFPHHPTLDQWFGESTFESYRALGEQLADDLCARNKHILNIWP